MNIYKIETKLGFLLASKRGTNECLKLITFLLLLVLIAFFSSQIFNNIVAIIILVFIPLFYCFFVLFRNECLKHKEYQARAANENTPRRETLTEPCAEIDQQSVISNITIVDETVNIHHQIEVPRIGNTVNDSTPANSKTDAFSAWNCPTSPPPDPSRVPDNTPPFNDGSPSYID